MDALKLADALGCSLPIANKWAAHITAAMERFQINTPGRVAAFLAQVGHESALLSRVSENLNYSVAGLLATFPRHFSAQEANTYQRQPMAIANRVYASRYGNGDEASGDGWLYRGRGPIQITFADNYRACGAGLGLDLLVMPDLLLQPEHAAASAAWYWQSRGCNALADAGDFDGISDVINRGHKTAKDGDANGYAARLALWESAKDSLQGVA